MDQSTQGYWAQNRAVATGTQVVASFAAGTTTVVSIPSPGWYELLAHDAEVYVRKGAIGATLTAANAVRVEPHSNAGEWLLFAEPNQSVTVTTSAGATATLVSRTE